MGADEEGFSTVPSPIRALATLTLGLLAWPASAAGHGARPGRFVATCEHLGRFCSARACGRDQIEAALGCRALCPGSIALRVVPVRCPSTAPVVLRRRG